MSVDEVSRTGRRSGARDDKRQLACALSEIPEEGTKRVLVGGRTICVVKSLGQVYALADTCSHADVSLAEGEVEDGTVECWLHGSKFDLRTGSPIGLPATKSVPTYPVTVIGDDVYLKVEKQ